MPTLGPPPRTGVRRGETGGIRRLGPLRRLWPGSADVTAPWRGPDAPIDERTLRSLSRERVQAPRREWTRSLGREGLQAGATLLMCATVIVGGWVVVLLTWTRTNVAATKVSVGILILAGWAAVTLVGLGSGALLARRLTSHRIVAGILVSGLVAALLAVVFWTESVSIRLPAFWIIQLVAIAVIGFILSGQFDKVWVRVFSLLGMAILAALLITIGRNERVNIAANAAENSYLQLTQISSQPGRDGDPPSPAAKVLVAELCALAGRDDCKKVSVAAGTTLNSCLPGWTYQAFREWAEAASIDREVAATAALARCELEAFEPGSIAASDAGDEPTEAALPDGSEPADEPTEEEQPSEEEGQAAIDDRIEEGAQTQAAIDVRVAVAEAIAVQRAEANLIETFSDGADGILASVSGPNEFAEFRFSGATWLVLLGLTLFWYRRLEIRAGSHGLGPVEIEYEDEPPPGNDGDTKDATSGASPGTGAVTGLHTGQAVFKQAVVQNVPEPGAVPGAQALAPVGDLISSTDVPNKWVATGFVDAIRTILATRGGYTVLYSAHYEASPGPDQHRRDHLRWRGKSAAQRGGTFVVFVRLRDTQSGMQQGSMRFESEYLSEAAQMAGYWVAGWIISRSRYVPEWAVWSERDAHAFYSLQWRQGDDLPLQAHGVVDPDRIHASTNALILAQRAYAYQISPKLPREKSEDATRRPYTLNALEDFARAAYHQPRYPVARYRRAVALSSLMHAGVELRKAYMPRRTPDADDETLPSVSRLLHLFRDLIGFRESTNRARSEDLAGWIAWARKHGFFPRPMRRAMLELSYAWLLESEESVSTGVVAQLRPSERRFWREFSRTGARGDWITLVRVSQQIVKLRLADAGLECETDAGRLAAICATARDPNSHWQISYNIGCFHALRAEQLANAKKAAEATDEATLAFDWLERCLDRPFSGQLVREWIDRDPDLHALRDMKDFPQHLSESWQRWRLRVPPMPVQIRQGDRSSAVQRMQKNLNLVAAAEVDPAPTELDDDGYFGPATRAAVEDFQYRHDLRVSGHPDLTMLALLETLAERPRTH